MPRLFVNSMANFVIQGGVVSFTLQDQAMRTEGGQPRQAPPEDVVDVVMREQDFVQLVDFLNRHLASYQQQAGRPAGAAGRAGSAAPADTQGPAPQAAGPGAAARPSGNLRIRPKGS